MNLVAWIRASRLASQSYIALPLLLGQVWAWSRGSDFDLKIFVLVQLFGFFDQLYIVFANDYADQATDKANETWTPFSGGSRVLVRGDISPHALGRAALVMACVVLGVGVVLAVGWGLVWAPLCSLAALALLWAYSYEPLKLSYRGGGELLQMLGVGLVLPLLGFYAQREGLHGFPWSFLWVFLPLQLMCAMCTALPDEPSDRSSAKHTTAVSLGGTKARAVILALGAASLAIFAMISPWGVASRETLQILAVPGLSWFLLLLVSPGAKPGTRRVLAFVFLGILVNLSLQVGVIVALWRS